MWKVLGIVLVLTTAVVGLTFYKGISTKSTIQSSTSSSGSEIPKVEVIAKDLEVPWALAFFPDKNILVTERAGRVRLIKDGKLEEKPVATILVKQTGESGLHGIAIHPKFPNPPFVYLYYTYSADNDSSLNRVSRFTFTKDSLTDEQIIVDKIPGAIFHDGGRIKFGPDGYLYITTGDAQNPSLAQDKNSLAGKILRVTDPSTHSVSSLRSGFGQAGSGQVEVYSYGHRNPQGIIWDDQGRLWETEHGQSATDELNLIEMGKNYGWPEIRGNQTRSGMERPVLQSGSDTWAPAGAAFYKGSIFYGGLKGTALYQYIIDTKEQKTHFKGEFGRIREVIIGPDNMLYITTSNRDGRGNPTPDDDKIIRVNPQL